MSSVDILLTRGDKRPHEWGRGTQECVRHGGESSGYFGYLAKAKLLEESRGLALPAPAAIPEGTNEWTRLAAHLWANRTVEERLSVGICPSTNEDDEGTFVAGLALVLRETLNKKTLLIDLDFERPVLAQALGSLSGPGLSEFLASDPAFRFDCIHETMRRGVFVMPAGAMRNRLGAREFEKRLRWLHGVVVREFPVVVIRFPAVNSVRRMRRCWKIPDIAVLTVRPGASRSSEVRREAKKMRASRANLIGLVLSELERSKT
jgi:Mrp family chromosome partitioning ATPase